MPNTRAAQWLGRRRLDAQSGRYSIAAGSGGSVTFDAPCPVIVIENLDATNPIYWAPGNDYASANPATNLAAQRLGPGQAAVIESPQRTLYFWNSAGAAVQVQLAGWRD